MYFGKDGLYCFYAMVFSFFLFLGIGSAQTPIKQFNEQDFDSAQFSNLANNKNIPGQIRPQVLTALSFYPELEDVKIMFRFRKRITPLSSRPQVISTFKKIKNRTYVITISNKSNKRLSPILFKNLSYNAQIGVLGHELGHIVEYNKMNTGQLLGLILKLLNSKYTDQFEFNTDLTSINHGLGHQLYDWSSYVRTALDINEWRGASDSNYSNQKILDNQRYMNPKTILSYIHGNPIYK